MKESIMPTKLMTFSNSNCMNSTSPIANLSNNISQQQLISNNQSGSTISDIITDLSK